MDSLTVCSLAVLQQFRNDNTFEKIFIRASELNGKEIPKPRVVARQRNRCNVSTDNVQEYYKRSAFLPFVDACFAQLTERFQKHAAGAYQLSRLLPSFCNDNDFSHIQEAVRLYNQFSPGGLHAAEIEFARWKQHWQRQPAADKPACCARRSALCDKIGDVPNYVYIVAHYGNASCDNCLEIHQDLPTTDNAWGRATERTNADVHNQDIGYS
jgi:hypothetical protein